jgi:hypothetical protein
MSDFSNDAASSGKEVLLWRVDETLRPAMLATDSQRSGPGNAGPG